MRALARLASALSRGSWIEERVGLVNEPTFKDAVAPTVVGLRMLPVAKERFAFTANNNWQEIRV